jgi:hypothetical protein
MISDQEELRAFAAKVETALAPGFAEVLSEETRKAQRALLVLSFLLFLVVLGAVKFSGDVEFIGIKFSGATAKGTVALLGLVVLAYLKVLVAIRSYSEWHLWLLRNRMGELDAKHLRQDLTSLGDAIYADLAASREGAGPGDVEIEIQRAPLLVRAPMPLLRALPLIRRFSVFFLGLRTTAKADRIIVSRATAKNIDHITRFGPQYALFYRDSEAYERSRRARVTIEIFFPLLFGFGAIMCALLSSLGVA